MAHGGEAAETTTNGAPAGWPKQPVEEKKAMLKLALVSGAVFAQKQAEARALAIERANAPLQPRKGI